MAITTSSASFLISSHRGQQSISTCPAAASTILRSGRDRNLPAGSETSVSSWNSAAGGVPTFEDKVLAACRRDGSGGCLRTPEGFTRA